MKKLFAIVVITFAFFGGCGKTSEGPNTTQCAPTHHITNVIGICMPSDFGEWHAHQVDRPAGGWVLLEIEANDAQKQLIGERIEAGLRQTIAGARAANPSWMQYSNPADYGVVMIRKHVSNMDGTPALIVGAQRVQTAGTVINTSTVRNSGIPYIVLPQPDEWPPADDPYWSYLQASARNEGEHVIEYKNDLGAFLIFAIEADVHPHWPIPGEARGFVGNRSSDCLLGAANGPVLNIEPIR